MAACATPCTPRAPQTKTPGSRAATPGSSDDDAAQNARTIHSLYREILGRSADGQGIEHYSHMLSNNTLTPAKLREVLSRSPEAIRAAPPPPDVGALAAGAVFDIIESSNGWATRGALAEHDADVRAARAEAYSLLALAAREALAPYAAALVRAAYRGVLQREADAEGAARYTHQLLDRSLAPGGGGTTVLRIEADMRTSSEFRTQRAVRAQLADMLASAPSVEAWIARAGLPPRSPADRSRALQVRYIGAFGTSGYATVARHIVHVLVRAGAEVQFVPEQWYHVPASLDAPDMQLLAACTRAPLLTPDVIVLHTVPDVWTRVVERERAAFPDTPIYGITVWETDATPRDWIAPMRLPDVVSVPCVWNETVFSHDVPGQRFETVFHPIIDSGASPDPSWQVPGVRDGDYIFYSINEFNNRKGLVELVRVFLDTFTAAQPVLLYIKTSGDVPEATARAWLVRERAARAAAGTPADARIELDYRILSETEIAAVHETGHCFVSLTKAEGTGLGVCQAALRGKPAIITGYGAQTEYLQGVGVHWVEASTEPANYCSGLHTDAAACAARGWCSRNRWYDATHMRWGAPSLAHAAVLMRTAAVERWGTQTEVRAFVAEHFNMHAVGAAFYASLLATVKRSKAAAVRWAARQPATASASAPVARRGSDTYSGSGSDSDCGTLAPAATPPPRRPVSVIMDAAKHAAALDPILPVVAAALGPWRPLRVLRLQHLQKRPYMMMVAQHEQQAAQTPARARAMLLAGSGTFMDAVSLNQSVVCIDHGLSFLKNFIVDLCEQFGRFRGAVTLVAAHPFLGALMREAAGALPPRMNIMDGEYVGADALLAAPAPGLRDTVLTEAAAEAETACAGSAGDGADMPLVLFAPTWFAKENTLAMEDASIALASLGAWASAPRAGGGGPTARVIMSQHGCGLRLTKIDGVVQLPGRLTHELLAVADVVVTDTSSVLFEAHALGKRVVQITYREYQDAGTPRLTRARPVLPRVPVLDVPFVGGWTTPPSRTGDAVADVLRMAACPAGSASSAALVAEFEPQAAAIRTALALRPGAAERVGRIAAAALSGALPPRGIDVRPTRVELTESFYHTWGIPRGVRPRASGDRIVLTFGTFDMLHEGHLSLLRRARTMGTSLVVGVSSDALNVAKKGSEPYCTTEERVRAIAATGLAETVFVEHALELKRHYLLIYGATVLIMGDDWAGRFDDMRDTVSEVVYLPRTPGIDSTTIRDRVRRNATTAAAAVAFGNHPEEAAAATAATPPPLPPGPDEAAAAAAPWLPPSPGPGDIASPHLPVHCLI